MDDTYLIDVAKTDFREAYEREDVDQLLSIFDEQGFIDMSEGGPSHYGEAAREALRERAAVLFARYAVRVAVIIFEIVVSGDVAYDYGCHEWTLKPKNGGVPVRKRTRYFETWKRNSAGQWKITSFIDNADVREQLSGYVSHWFLGEEQLRASEAPQRL